jgi:hypothetical protein
MMIAEIRVQKKSALPKPKGCLLFRLRFDFLSPISKRPDATRSENPSNASASITALPVALITITFRMISPRSTRKDVQTALSEDIFCAINGSLGLLVTFWYYSGFGTKLIPLFGFAKTSKNKTIFPLSLLPKSVVVAVCALHALPISQK